MIEWCGRSESAKLPRPFYPTGKTVRRWGRRAISIFIADLPRGSMSLSPSSGRQESMR